MGTMLVPPWLERLLNTSFFNICRTHGDAARSECNMYCLDCNADAFCFYCRSSKHKDHQVIQIRRSSYHDVVRVSEIQKVLDISGVQTYVINSARVLFLNERPQPKGGKAVSHVCEICGRSLLDTFRFCSLGCKVVGIKGNGDASFIEAASSSRRGGGNYMMSSSSSRDQEEELRDGSQQDIYPPTPPPPPSSSRSRRKGIPQRAPFRS
ncbi:protein RGF1 INDUCIBLE TRANSCRIPTION FACTOR 1-like isoform X2 [Salvia miltiorrhiza]|uniref:protein RGF1 INDUCIBLE TRANSCRIPTION FACTOR 1-like isoform X2 n=1 Tax=Salvia miltiorrhiza TaxID=226208 RepID=UPI0025AD83F1|nr:protein RGF1 INDUCIBLE TRANSCRIPTION FACTOR 1-like isoform X2 [Salvia miltiorrhiza]